MSSTGSGVAHEAGGFRARVVDCHAHTVPRALLEMLSGNQGGLHGFGARRSEHGWVLDVPGNPDPVVLNPRMSEPDRRHAWCTDLDVTAQVLSPWMDIQATGAMNAADARDWSRRLNDYMLALVRSEGSDSPALATIAVHRPEVAAEDLSHAVLVDGFDGLILSTDPHGHDHVGVAELEPVWSAAEELGVPVMLHPPTDGPSSRLPSIGVFGNVYGRLVDTTLAASRLILSGVLDRHPRLSIVLVHGGGFLPFQANRFDGGHRLPPLNGHRLERESPSAYLKDFYFDTVALSAASIGYLENMVGYSRLLFGSDYPFPLGGADPVEPVRAGLRPEAVDSVLGGNARALFDRSVHV
jgi:aminocarboxymuconate-semialdehyde decarboxylase